MTRDEYGGESAAEVLSEMTGRPVEDFQPDDDLEYPKPDELESVYNAD